MAENSKIEWTDHTVNFWWGCMKVSPGCANCYAENESHRRGRNVFGPAKTTERWRTTGPWKDILKWDKKAKKEGVRRKVFAQSMSDFFEYHPQLEEWRAEAITILEGLAWLDVQLLTKRPENVARMAPQWMEHWPQHIWMGTSVENQEMADKRIPELLKIPARVRFLSCEPLLGPVDLRHIQFERMVEIDALTGDYGVNRPLQGRGDAKIHWVIVGGESQHGARPMHPQWAKWLRDQCRAVGTAFFFKQWGEYVPASYEEVMASDSQKEDGLQPWPMVRVGKKVAGRLLDGREWNEFPGDTLFRSDVAELDALWPQMPNLTDGVDLFEAKYGEPTGTL